MGCAEKLVLGLIHGHAVPAPIVSRTFAISLEEGLVLSFLRRGPLFTRIIRLAETSVTLIVSGARQVHPELSQHSLALSVWMLGVSAAASVSQTRSNANCGACLTGAARAGDMAVPVSGR